MKTVTFCGHRDIIPDERVRSLLHEAIEAEIQNGAEQFYVGGRGEFDSMAAAAVRAAKRRHRDKIVQLYLVEPYMREGINRDRSYYESLYDGIIIPQELLGVHPKAAITKRNRWMIQKADCLIAFVQRDFGGAYQTLNYAMKKGIRIINLAENK